MGWRSSLVTRHSSVGGVQSCWGGLQVCASFSLLLWLGLSGKLSSFLAIHFSPCPSQPWFQGCFDFFDEDREAELLEHFLAQGPGVLENG
jgi:hypothetical protein